jgi:hypothetical protein
MTTGIFSGIEECCFGIPPPPETLFFTEAINGFTQELFKRNTMEITTI